MTRTAKEEVLRTAYWAHRESAGGWHSTPGPGRPCQDECMADIAKNLPAEVLVLTVERDGSISRVAGGPLEEPIETGATTLPGRTGTNAAAERLHHHWRDTGMDTTFGPELERALAEAAIDAIRRSPKPGTA